MRLTKRSDSANSEPLQPNRNLWQKYGINGVIIVVIVAIIAFSIFGFYKNYEKVIVTNYELNTRVHYNPFYAAELLINQQHTHKDTPVSGVNAPALDDDSLSDQHNQVAITLHDSNFKALVNELPSLADGGELKPTLIINSIGGNLTEANFEQLRDWIEAGGHLITFGEGQLDTDAMQAILTRLDELNNENASIDSITSDDTLNELLEDLGSGNRFLTKLGIYVVDSDNNVDDDDNLDRQFYELLAQLEDQQGSVDESASQNDDEYSAQLRHLKATQPMSVMRPRHTSDDPMVVTTAHAGRQLNSQLFETLYADKLTKIDANKNEYSLNEDGYSDGFNKDGYATLIRTYLHAQKQLLLEQIAQHKKDNVTTTTEENSLSKQEKEILKLILALEKLDDDILISLFKPINEVYKDYKFGQGRLSVIIDKDAFINPDPNLVLPVRKVRVETGEVLEQSIPLPPQITTQDLLAHNYYRRHSLYDANNAAWLDKLTQDSSQVWILPNTDVDMLPVMLWKQARLALLGLGLLLIVWLWSLYNRFGKIQTLSQAHSYDILNYFRQVGRYGWQQDHATKLTSVARDKVKQIATEALRYHSHQMGESGYTDESVTHQQVLAIDFGNAKNSVALYEILKSNLQEKRQLEKQQTVNGFITTNYAQIVDLIEPRRLRQALAPGLQDGIRADDFTDMTQTLWIIEWLLK